MTAQKVGILVGGGPAPGINSVFASATIRLELGHCEVVGIFDGFRWLMQGDKTHVEELTIDKVSPAPVESRADAAATTRTACAIIDSTSPSATTAGSCTSRVGQHGATAIGALRGSAVWTWRPACGCCRLRFSCTNERA